MQIIDLIYAGLLGHAAAAISYALLFFFALYYRRKTLSGVLFAAASLLTCVWSATATYDLVKGMIDAQPTQVFEIAATSGWMLLVLSLLAWVPPVQRSSWAAIIIGMGLCDAVLAVLFGDPATPHEADARHLAVIVGRLALALAGAALVENLVRNSPRQGIWKLKYLCFGAGALFVYDFFLYSDALLFRHLDPGLLLARGPINFFAAPLFGIYALRNRNAGPQMSVSRQFVFRSATLVGAGVYLIAMAAAGYYVRRFGGTWSTFLQAIFLFGAVLLLLLPISSGSFRARLRVLVEKNLFTYKYDYRDVWLRFIKTISTSGERDDLRSRVIQAVCEIFDSPDGALWCRGHSGKYEMVAEWNASRWGLITADTKIEPDSPLICFLERSQWTINIEEFGRTPERYEGLSDLPVWLPQLSRAWLAVPLLHRDRLFGVIVVGRPRALRDLAWEDFDLMKTVARQAASYLAEHETSEALTEARQFEAFNKRFAFIAHDIKNLVSQLSLIVTNAARHRDNAAFQQDAHETLRRSVEKLNHMLQQLRAPLGSPVSQSPKATALAPLLQDIVASRAELKPSVSVDIAAENASIAADHHRLRTIVEHLLQNAADAVGPDGLIQVRLSNAGNMAVLEIEDNGPGMDADFINNKLFRPFVTTKGTGYGIGVYESREYALSLGGRLDVESHPGKGTIMRVSFPMATRMTD